jgi:hypothetical protein
MTEFSNLLKNKYYMYKVAKSESVGEDVKSHKSNRHSKGLDSTNLQIITYFLLEFDDGNELDIIHHR